MCVFKGDIWAPIIYRVKVPSFLTITLVGLKNYNDLMQMELIRLKWFSCLGRSLWIPKSEFHLGASVLYMLYCSLARDVAVSINKQDRQMTRQDVAIDF